MNVREFVRKYYGVKVDFDNAFGYQCVDLFRQYCKEVWEIPQLPSVVGAKDFYKHVVKSKYLSTGDTVSIGDCLIYGATDANPYGHICIVYDVVDNDNFLVFEQDGYRQDGARFNYRDRKNLLCSTSCHCLICKHKNCCPFKAE